VGKTRALYEAARAVLPEWWLIHPADTDAIRTFAAVPATRTVLWLDELQRYPEWCECNDTEAERRYWHRLGDDRNPGLADGIAAIHDSTKLLNQHVQ